MVIKVSCRSCVMSHVGHFNLRARSYRHEEWMARHGDGCRQGCDEATKAKALFKVVMPTPVATTLFITRSVDNTNNMKGNQIPNILGESIPRQG